MKQFLSAFVCDSQAVAHANLITGARIPEEKNRLLRNVVSDNLQKEGVVTRVEVIKRL